MAKKSRFAKIISSRTVRIVCALGLAWFLAHELYIIWDGTRPYEGSAEVAVVLGNAVRPDTSLSPVLKGRVDKALELYRAHRVQKLFLSGGVKNSVIPEGDAMRRYLLANGVPSKDMIVDNAGANTFHTALDFVSWNRTEHFSSAIIVSSFYHITRCKYIFRKMGYTHFHTVASTDYFWNDLVGLAREFPAFYVYRLLYR